MADGTLRLERLNRSHAAALVDMAEEFRAEGNLRLAPVLEDIDVFFDDVDRFAAGAPLPADRVQQSQFLLFRSDRLLGSVRVRHRLIPVLLRDGGHIGYEVRPSERGHGYGSAILARALQEARRIGLVRVLLTAEEHNHASLHVIEKAGGTPDGTSISHNTGAVMRHYWIELESTT